jgi:ABC-type phosphate transport system permease subunit
MSRKQNSGRFFMQKCGFGFMRVAAIINIGALLAILGLIFVESLPALSWEFLTEPPRNMMSEGGTFFLSAGALVIALPLGVASAVYLHEYGGSSAWVTLTRLSIANLAGVPSIVFGLFGLTFFVVFCGLDVSLLSGILTLSVLSLPVIINTTEALAGSSGLARSESRARRLAPRDDHEGSSSQCASRDSDGRHSRALPRGRGNGRHHVHGQRLLHAQDRREPF